MGTAAASSKDRLAGFKTNASSGAHTYSAKPPQPPADISPNTSSPGLNCVTFLPTTSTCPAISDPRISFLGFRSPELRRIRKGSALRRWRSAAFADTAYTLTNNSLSLGLGFSTSLSSRTSGEPYSSYTIAFIWVSFLFAFFSSWVIIVFSFLTTTRGRHHLCDSFMYKEHNYSMVLDL